MHDVQPVPKTQSQVTRYKSYRAALSAHASKGLWIIGMINGRQQRTVDHGRIRTMRSTSDYTRLGFVVAVFVFDLFDIEGERMKTAVCLDITRVNRTY